MNQLDQIAARATDSIHIAVANRAPVTNVPRLISLRRRGIALRFAMGAAALVGVIGLAGIVQLEDRGGDPTNGSSTTASSCCSTRTGTP